MVKNNYSRLHSILLVIFYLNLIDLKYFQRKSRNLTANFERIKQIKCEERCNRLHTNAISSCQTEKRHTNNVVCIQCKLSTVKCFSLSLCDVWSNKCFWLLSYICLFASYLLKFWGKIVIFSLKIFKIDRI